MNEDFRSKAELQLLSKIKTNLIDLEKLLKEISGESPYEEMVYRFYYHSFKVYFLQSVTSDIVKALERLKPEGTEFSPFFEDIVKNGASGKHWQEQHNAKWMLHTAPILEAFFHAKFFLEMVVKAGKELAEPPTHIIPYGWAAILCLFRLR